MYLAERTNKHFIKQKTFLAAIEDSDQGSAPRHFYMQKAYEHKMTALTYWVNAAYTRAILLDPFCQKTLDQVGCVTDIGLETYAIEKLYGRNPPIFTFKDASLPPIGENEIELVDRNQYYSSFSAEKDSLESLSYRLSLN